MLFIDARKLGRMVDRTHRELTDEDIARIANTYHAWRGEGANGRLPLRYENIPGFCYSATIDEIRNHGHVLTPGRYVGAEVKYDDDEPFAYKMRGLPPCGASSRPRRRGWMPRSRPTCGSWGFEGCYFHDMHDVITSPTVISTSANSNLG